MIKLFRILSVLAAVIPVSGVSVASPTDISAGQGQMSLQPILRNRPVNYSPARVVTSPGFLYENFESVPDDTQALPEGWTAISTPGLPTDTWSAGTLGRDGTPMNGVSGYKYAYILGNMESDASHDAWLFSPGLLLAAGTEYNIEFFAMMPPVTGSDNMEKLQVYIGTQANVASMTYELETIENDNDYWRYYTYTFTPVQSGTYHIGFHSLSPAASNSTAIDDVKISCGAQPIFSASATIDLGTTDTFSGVLKGEYKISNGGEAPLEVTLKSAPEGVSIEGLPLTLEEYDEACITISVTSTEAGPYNGILELATNDLTLPEVEVHIRGTVEQARVTGYNFENFENGGPEGWVLTTGSGNVATYGGFNSSRAYYTTTYYGSDDINPGWGGVGFMTHYIEMGENPVISFWYQMANVDFSGNVSGPAESSKVEVYVQVSEDGGNTFDTVYTVMPGSEHEHTATLDFTNIEVPIPQYAGKTSRVRVVFNQPGGGSFFDQVRVLADDVSVGSQRAVDLRSTSLLGETLLMTGCDYELTSTIENLGTESTSDYKVELIDMANGDKLAEADGVEVQGGKSVEVTLRWTAERPGSVKLQSRVISESDPVSDNNDSYPYIAQVLPTDNSVISINHGDKTMKAMSFPINFYAVESMTQSIFPANDIGITAGTINSLVFTSCLDSDFYGEPFTVYIGETDKPDFSEVSMVDPASLTKVFDGTIYMESGIRDLVIPFDKTYDYRGGNIVVMCQKLGTEFVMGQYFIIHETKGVDRSIQATTLSKGTLVEGGYSDLTAAEVYPEIRFNIVKAPAGKVDGTVSDANGPVEGAQVKVSGTNRYETTDADGRYSFAEIAEGEVALEVSRHDYYVLTSEPFTLGADVTEVKNFVLSKLPRYTLQGTITSETTDEPVKDVRVQVSGYDDYIVRTDESGHYSITNIAGDTSEEYAVRVTSGYFHAQNSHVTINSDVVLDFTLKEKNLRAHNVKATPTASGTLVTWENPMPEFRYDSGEPVDYIGWTHGSSEVIVGAAFYNKAKIKEISWYTTNRYGNHQNFNVFIFGLDNEGNPDAKKLLYTARDVDFTDNVWSSHILSQPIEADGFMIAVSCDGFMGIGVCDPTGEYPFEEGQAFYAGDSYTSHISPMSTFANVHPMLRAYGEDLGDMTPRQMAPARIIAPKVDYKVYRCAEGENLSKANLIATTTDLSLLDTSAESGKYRYAVIAAYKSGDSEPIYSNMLELSSVATIMSDGVSISYEPLTETIHITGSESVAELAVVNLSGVVMLHQDHPRQEVSLQSLPVGIYMAAFTLSNGSRKCFKLNKR
ncbi:MAG: carboxypeptidase regulatory-like domain-containing protein [Muribaculaceae bacterium]|nr:carboxypeptidase regulatory-like domain-containing protein [Muribaculaceae bacterium]